MESYESCTQLKYEKIYNALSWINNCTVEAAKFKLNSIVLN